MPSLPRTAMNFAVVQDVGYRLPGVTAFAAARVALPKPLGGIQLKHSKAGPVDKIPITESSIVARLDKMIRGGVEGERPNSLALIRKGGEACDVRGLKLIPRNPYHDLCGRRGDRYRIG
ncbi:hypothetical protein TNCT_166701 [Trichonephila clavata]|uniref:Uncharacterized protein n=1 Tax=Trichonephila clavata TaxID=2740835 RepID=A0A8X6L994_TRICU|nr:hypothetical protein TNCT_166701 [Trichonephila clavata]